MMKEVESGKVGTILIKDMSRMGRDYLKVGTCSAYSKVPVGTLCQTQHRINADVVMELIKELLKAVAEYSQLNREEFLETVKRHRLHSSPVRSQD